MKFIGQWLLVRNPDDRPPAPEHDRLREAVDLAVWAEEVGYDGFGYGERHSPVFLSPSPAVLLSHLAAKTSRIRLFTTVSVLSLTDPVRSAEDYALVDHLSEGRLELIVGKGNDANARALFSASEADQWDRHVEAYELVRRLWREESVNWDGRFRPPLRNATTTPRPFQAPAPRVWHGSSSSLVSVELAAKWGDPLYSANGTKPVPHYLRLVEHYREQLAFHGHDPATIPVAVGVHSPVIATRSQDARALAQPAFEAFRKTEYGGFAYDSLDEFIRKGSGLIGSPAEVTEKLLELHQLFDNQLFGVGLQGFLGADPDIVKPHVERFFADVAPAVRTAVPTKSW